jgi:hypothetical protein
MEVLVLMSPVELGPLDARDVQRVAQSLHISKEAVSHWALVVIDRAYGDCKIYDLMSDAPVRIGIKKNYERVNDLDEAYINRATTLKYIGQTTKSHSYIAEKSE